MRKAVMQLLGGNVLSKAIGALREVLTAALFGTGQVIGAFRIAQTGTLAPVNFLTSDSLNAAFIPLYKNALKSNLNQAQTLFWGLFFWFVVLSVALAIVLWGFAYTWISIIAPGLQSSTLHLAADMLRVMAIGVPFYIISSLFMFLAMGNDNYLPASLRPSIQNIGLIAGIIAAYLLQDMIFLSWGFTLAYAGFSVWQLWYTWKAGYLSFPTLWSSALLKKCIGDFWEALRHLIFLPFLLQGTILVERYVASLIGVGAVSSVDYAKFITESVILFSAIPIAQVGLSHWSGRSYDEIKGKLNSILLFMLLLGVPLSVYLAVNASTIVEVLYSRGEFDTESVQTTSSILFGLSLGLWAHAAGYILIKTLNSQLKNATVFRIMSMSLFAGVLFNLLFYRTFGAMTLGLSNSLYGLFMLIGSVVALGLWRTLFTTGGSLLSASSGYILLCCFIPKSENVWIEFFVVSCFAFFYWAFLVSVVPQWRSGIRSIILRKNVSAHS